MPVQTLTTVLAMLQENDPYAVVVHLVDEARTVAAGRAPDVYRLEQAIDEARGLAGRVARDEPDVDALLGQVRLCLLDPLRPGPDLLEDLLRGIYGCWLVWDEGSSESTGTGAGIERESEVHGEELDDDLNDDLEDPGREEASRRRFCDALRDRGSAGL